MDKIFQKPYPPIFCFEFILNFVPRIFFVPKKVFFFLFTPLPQLFAADGFLTQTNLTEGPCEGRDCYNHSEWNGGWIARWIAKKKKNGKVNCKVNSKTFLIAVAKCVIWTRWDWLSDVTKSLTYENSGQCLVSCHVLIFKFWVLLNFKNYRFHLCWFFKRIINLKLVCIQRM